MKHEAILSLVTWVITVTAIVYLAHSTVTHQSTIGSIILMLVAIAAQNVYGKRLKHKLQKEENQLDQILRAKSKEEESDESE